MYMRRQDEGGNNLMYMRRQDEGGNSLMFMRRQDEGVISSCLWEDKMKG